MSSVWRERLPGWHCERLGNTFDATASWSDGSRRPIMALDNMPDAPPRKPLAADRRNSRFIDRWVAEEVPAMNFLSHTSCWRSAMTSMSDCTSKTCSGRHAPDRRLTDCVLSTSEALPFRFHSEVRRARISRPRAAATRSPIAAPSRASRSEWLLVRLSASHDPYGLGSLSLIDTAASKIGRGHG